MADEKTLKVPGRLVDAVKLRMYKKKISYAEAAKEVLAENPEKKTQ